MKAAYLLILCLLSIGSAFGADYTARQHGGSYAGRRLSEDFAYGHVMKRGPYGGSASVTIVEKSLSEPYRPLMADNPYEKTPSQPLRAGNPYEKSYTSQPPLMAPPATLCQRQRTTCNEVATQKRNDCIGPCVVGDTECTGPCLAEHDYDRRVCDVNYRACEAGPSSPCDNDNVECYDTVEADRTACRTQCQQQFNPGSPDRPDYLACQASCRKIAKEKTDVCEAEYEACIKGF
ncbi:Hypothetical protein POVN_LOCUS586 [uncultured virus]|nr:Hypothetical protein POVN_LOCUS586 [uncultured virus]